MKSTTCIEAAELMIPRATTGVLALALLCVAAAGNARALKIKIGTVAPAGTLPHKALLEMAEVFALETEGSVELKVYAGVVGDEGTIVRKMRVGQLQGAMLTSKGLALFSTEQMAVQVPMLFADTEEMDAVFAQMQPTFDAALEEDGLISLSWCDGGWLYFFTKRPAVSPQDIVGMKMWMWPHASSTAESFSVTGFRPVVLSEADVVPSLQTGMIEVFPATPLTAFALQTFRYTPHVIDVRWSSMLAGVVILNSTWKEIDPERAVRIRQRCMEIGRQLSARVRRDSNQALQIMIDKGLTVHIPDASQMKTWASKAKAALAVVRGSGVDAALVDRAIELRDIYRKEHAATATENAPR